MGIGVISYVHTGIPSKTYWVHFIQSATQNIQYDSLVSAISLCITRMKSNLISDFHNGG